MYCKTKKSASLGYFDTFSMHNIERISNRRWHDFLSIYNKDKESCLHLSKTLFASFEGFFRLILKVEKYRLLQINNNVQLMYQYE